MEMPFLIGSRHPLPWGNATQPKERNPAGRSAPAAVAGAATAGRRLRGRLFSAFWGGFGAGLEGLGEVLAVVGGF